MKRGRKLDEGRGCLEIIEEAVHLLRLAPAGVLTAYYVGSLPFIMAFLYFWADMSRSAFAYYHCAEASLGLSLLFIWMKCWQAVFARRLRAWICGDAAPRWPLRRAACLAAAQAFIQPSALFALPLAGLLAVPFGWVYAFYHNVSVIGDGGADNIREVLSKSWRQARLWPKQNHFLIFIFGVFGLFVFGNIAAAVLILPHIVKVLTGCESIFTLSFAHVLNTTFFAAACGICYLCMNPLIKAVYVLRCFYGESLRTGEDLRVQLRNLGTPGKMLAAVFIALMCASPVAGKLTRFARNFHRGYRPLSLGCMPRSIGPHSDAASLLLGARVLGYVAPLLTSGASQRATGSLLRCHPLGEGKFFPPDPLIRIGNTISCALRGVDSATQDRQGTKSDIRPAELDRSIEEVMKQPRYSWRMPRDGPTREARKGWLGGFLEGAAETVRRYMRKAYEWVKDLAERIIEWLEERFFPRQRHERERKHFDIAGIHGLLLVLLAVVSCGLAILYWRERGRRRAILDADSGPIEPVPDIADEDVGPGELPVNGWLAMASELMKNGELRLALRALYLATLAHLAEMNIITIARFKTNRDYESELRRRAHAHPDLVSAFTQNMTVFERIWYGVHEVNKDIADAFTSNYERMSVFGKE